MGNIQTVQQIYAAFGRGDIPAVLGHLDENVEWGYAITPIADVPWLQPRHGRDQVPKFFDALGAWEFHKFQPKTFLESEGVVVVLLDLEVTVKATGRRIVEEDEVHIWHFNSAGRVARYGSKFDTHQHWEAYREMAQGEPDQRVLVKSVELPTGVKLQYVEQGDPSGVPVLLLHGLSDSWHSFETVLPHLPESIRAFALTQRGHGDSTHPEEGYRPHDFAADVAAFMDALGLEAAVVAGHSLGSAVAQRFAIDHPGRTLGLVLAGSFASLAASPVAQGLWDEVVSKMEDPVDPGFVREFQESTLAQPVPQAFMETVVRESLKLPAHVWRATVAGTLQDEFSEELGKIEAPTLLVWGDQDGMVPRGDQDAQTAAIASSRLVVYEGAGHAVHWEEPERFASDLVTFVEISKPI